MFEHELSTNHRTRNVYHAITFPRNCAHGVRRIYTRGEGTTTSKTNHFSGKMLLINSGGKPVNMGDRCRHTFRQQRGRQLINQSGGGVEHCCSPPTHCRMRGGGNSLLSSPTTRNPCPCFRVLAPIQQTRRLLPSRRKPPFLSSTTIPTHVPVHCLPNVNYPLVQNPKNKSLRKQTNLFLSFPFDGTVDGKNMKNSIEPLEIGGENKR